MELPDAPVTLHRLLAVLSSLALLRILYRQLPPIVPDLRSSSPSQSVGLSSDGLCRTTGHIEACGNIDEAKTTLVDRRRPRL